MSFASWAVSLFIPPSFSRGVLAHLPDDFKIYGEHRYFLIERRRWSEGEGWVYSGKIYEVHNSQLFLATSGTCFLEKSFKLVLIEERS